MTTSNTSELSVAADHPQGDFLLATNSKAGDGAAASSTQLNPKFPAGTVIIFLSAAFLFFFLWLYYICCTDADSVAGILRRGRRGRLVQLRQRDFRCMVVEAPRPLLPLPLLPVASCHGAGGTASTDCVICLSEFEDEEEMVKVIPSCRHVFHLQCIDRWLLSHGSCMPGLPMHPALCFPWRAVCKHSRGWRNRLKGKKEFLAQKTKCSKQISTSEKILFF